MSTRAITPADLMDRDAYRRTRGEARRRISAVKRDREVRIGPVATLYFENFETVLHLVRELLLIGDGDAAQVEAELAAYGSMTPRGRELTATAIFETEDPLIQAQSLSPLAGLESCISLDIAGERIAGVADAEAPVGADRTAGVAFVVFPFTSSAADAFKAGLVRATFRIDHPNYAHATDLTHGAQMALAADLD